MVVQEMIDELSGFVDSLNSVTQKVEGTLVELNERAAGFADEIGDHQRSITIHTLFEESLSKVKSPIQDVLQSIKPYLAKVTKEDVKLHLENLETQYTMHSERYLHHSYIIQDNADAVHIKTPMLAKVQEHNLGDNIELF